MEAMSPPLLARRRSFSLPTHTASKQGAHQKLVISLIHCDSLETEQTYLCVVHPIYQEDEQALHTDKERKRKDKVVTVAFSLIL